MSCSYTVRAEVFRANERHLMALDGPVISFIAVEGGILGPNPERTRLLNSLVVPKFVHLKIGASVILTKNLSDFEELCNGSVGKVIDFRSVDDIGPDDGILMSRPHRPIGLWPVVEFPCRSGNVHRILMLQETWKVEGNKNTVLVSRKQVSPFTWFSVLIVFELDSVDPACSWMGTLYT